MRVSIVTKRSIVSIVFLVVFASIAQAQNKWVHADFFRITEGKVTEYRAEQTSKTMPQHQQLVKQGKSYAMIAYQPLFPHGEETAGEVRLSIRNSFADAAGNQTARGFAPGLYKTIRGELWRLDDAVLLDELVKAEYVRAVFHKLKPGQTIQDYRRLRAKVHKPEIEKRIAGGSSKIGAVGYFSVTYPAGQTTEYDAVAIFGYADLAAVEPQTEVPADLREANEQMRKITDVVRVQLWRTRERTDLGAAK